ncbi:MAG: hypothetical protein U1A78_01975 [Polyangia bacterium]
MTLVLLGALVWLALAAYFQPVPGASESERGVGALWSALLSSVVALSLLLRGVVRGLSGEPWLLAPSLLGFLVLFPFATCRFVTMPLGLVRTTYALSFLCFVRFSEDPRGAAVLLGALTLLRARRPDSQGGRGAAAEQTSLRFLEGQLARLPKLGGAGLVAQALLCARRGDREGARALLATLSTLDPRVYPPWAEAVACDYLVVDALARGDSAAVHRQVAAAREVPPLSRLIAAGTPTHGTEAEPKPGRPGRFALWLLYLRTSQLRQAWPLLQRALQPSPPSPPSPPPSNPAAPDGRVADLPGALAELTRLLAAAAPRLTVADFRRVGGALEQALSDPQTQRRVLERALALGMSAAGPGGVSGDTALAAMRTDASQALAVRLRESGLPFGPLDDAASATRPTVLGAAVAVLRGELLGDLEAACQALRGRTLDKRELPRLDEWREWATLRSQYQQVGERGGHGARRLGWTAFHRDVCNFAVWLWNVRSEKILANAVFRFLLAEAEALDDDRSAALAKKNIACGI